MLYFLPFALILVLCLTVKVVGACDVVHAFDQYMRDFNEASRLFGTPEAEPYLNAVEHYFHLVTFHGTKIDKKFVNNFLTHADIKYEIETTGVATTHVHHDTAIGTYKETFLFGDGVAINTHECTVAVFDMEKCVPKTWNQVLDQSVEDSVWAKYANVVKNKIRMDHAAHREL